MANYFERCGVGITKRDFENAGMAFTLEKRKENSMNYTLEENTKIHEQLPEYLIEKGCVTEYD